MSDRPAILRRPVLAIESILALASLYLASGANATFWKLALAGRAPGDPATVRYAVSVLALLAALHFLALGLVATRRILRPLLASLILLSALANYFMQAYGVVFDPSMLRNALQTDPREAAELMSAGLLAALGAGAALCVLLWVVKIAPVSGRAALRNRSLSLAAALVLATGALATGYKDLASQMRNERALRYTISPANVLWSAARAMTTEARAAAAAPPPLEPVSRTAPAKRKPLLLAMVLGETARAANFSLNGYARETNPQLATFELLNFRNTTACGTSTAASVPCLFSPFGRAEYDEDRIRRQESMLKLLARAGLDVVWLDNQSGCKGVCDERTYHHMAQFATPGLCADGQCQDAILVPALARIAATLTRDTVVVLHQMGNHGPAYFRRYPPEMKRFLPACESRELRDCTPDEIRNAYDNAILYTDHVLAESIRLLASLQSRFDVALLYVSDHGESLGEHGLYLHGLPYAIAPREQLEVPMFWWMPAAFLERMDLERACLARKVKQAASHDNVYHSILGLLEVSTPRYRTARDLFLECRRLPVQAAAPAPGA